MDKQYFLKGGNAVENDDIRQFIAERISNWFSSAEKNQQMMDIHGYIQDLKDWILSSQKTLVRGLSEFKVACVSLGVTQALDQFHYDILREGRHLRMFRGEYPYSKNVHPFFTDNDYIDERPLEKLDAVVISCPFSATGSIHSKMNKILDEALLLCVPVFVDAAWFGTCGDIELDFQHPAITHVAFSVTKGLTAGNYRSGVRFSRSLESLSSMDRLFFLQHWNYSIHLNLKIGRELMKRFSPDTQYLKYRETQIQICNEYNLLASPCVHIATTQEQRWGEFSRDGVVNRINLRTAIKKRLAGSH